MIETSWPEADQRRFIAERRGLSSVPDMAVPLPVVIPGADTYTRTERANGRRALGLMAFPAALAWIVAGLIVGVLLGPWAGFILGLAVGLVVGTAVWRTGPARLIRAIGARRLHPGEQLRALNLLEGLCATIGLRPPELLIVDSPFPNAAAAGRSPRHGVIVLSTGLIALMSRIELEAVLAHELSHVKRNDHAANTMAFAAFGPLAPVLAGWSLSLGSRGGVGDRNSSGALGSTEAMADQDGVRLTRYPPGLIAALTKLASNPGVSGEDPACPPSGSVARATAHMWLVPPEGRPNGRGGISAIEERIEALREL